MTNKCVRRTVIENSTCDISFIVSAFSRPHQLPACLWSIYAQTHTDFECLVTDNSMHHSARAKHRASVNDMRDPRFRYLLTGIKIPVPDPYWNFVAGQEVAKSRIAHVIDAG